MSDKKKENIFVRFFKGIGRRFVEVRQEMKRVIWPTKEKLAQIAVVVLTVILFAAVLLSLVGKGTNQILTWAGFYHQAEETTAATTAVETTAAETTVTVSGTTTSAADTTAETSQS